MTHLLCLRVRSLGSSCSVSSIEMQHLSQSSVFRIEKPHCIPTLGRNKGEKAQYLQVCLPVSLPPKRKTTGTTKCRSRAGSRPSEFPLHRLKRNREVRRGWAGRVITARTSGHYWHHLLDVRIALILFHIQGTTLLAAHVDKHFSIINRGNSCLSM